MKWIFELTEIPKNPSYPITGTQLFESGAKNGPFYFSIEDFVQSFQNADRSIGKLEFQSSPILPKGTVLYESTSDKAVQRFCIEYPKSQYDIRYGENDFFRIGFPRLLVKYEIRVDTKRQQDEGICYYVSSMKIFAIEDNGQTVTDNTEIFQFPFPNVYKESGEVCMGANGRIEVDNIEDLPNKLRVFLQSPFNEDLGMVTTLGMSSFKQFIQMYQDKPFEDEWLLPNEKKLNASSL